MTNLSDPKAAMAAILNAQFQANKPKLDEQMRRHDKAMSRLAVPPANPSVAKINGSAGISAMLAALGKTDSIPTVVPPSNGYDVVMRKFEQWDGEDGRVSRAAEFDSLTGTALVVSGGNSVGPVGSDAPGESLVAYEEPEWVDGDVYVEPEPEPQVIYRDRVVYVRDAEGHVVRDATSTRQNQIASNLRVAWERSMNWEKLPLTDAEIFAIHKAHGSIERITLPRLTDAVIEKQRQQTLRKQLEESIRLEEEQKLLDDSLNAEIDAARDELLQIGFDDEFNDERVDDTQPDSRFLSIMEGITFKPDASQEAAVRGLAQVQYGCLIGAAGTGKTSTVKILLNTLLNGDAEAGIEPLRIRKVDIKAYHAKENLSDEEREELDHDDSHVIPAIAFVAFTGQATQVLKRNLPAGWKANAMTIHSLLGFAPEVYFNESTQKDAVRFIPTYTYTNKMPWNVIFVDEASMVNVTLWHQLLEAAPEGCRFYMIGDLNQLPPPIGQGILGFALVKWPVFELTTVHRQSEEAANKIIDSAWNILNGKPVQFDNPETNKNWRVIGFEIDHNPDKAHQQIVMACKALSLKKVEAWIDPATPAIYDPWRDRVMCAMNGFNEGDPNCALGQFPINDSLSQMFTKKEEPRVIIDIKRGVKKFKVGFRVMATKNESPGQPDRVTNGLTGKIVEIEPNPDWMGDRSLVGYEDIVKENRQKAVLQALGKTTAYDPAESEEEDPFNLSDLKDIRVNAGQETEQEKQAGPASHVVTVEFDNGATRIYRRNGQVEQLQIAYASTVHKTQGAEMPTAIIVVHHGQRRMLSRELLYTAVTRASQRVILLYTQHGMKLALGTQRITGNTLREKAVQYLRLMGEGTTGPKFKIMDVALTYEDMEARFNKLRPESFTFIEDDSEQGTEDAE